MSAEFHKKKSRNTVNLFKFLLILTVSAAVLGSGKSGALATVWNISETDPCLQLHRVRVAQRDDRNLSNSKGTLKESSAICLDPDDVVGIPKAEARRRFILNKIYLVQEGTTPDDLFIVDEKANKRAVEDVSEATAGATTNSVAQIVSGNIVSSSMGTIKSMSIIPHPPTDDSRLPTDHHSGVTGIDITGESGRRSRSSKLEKNAAFKGGVLIN